jgi:Tfp pilus assembly protein PilW
MMTFRARLRASRLAGESGITLVELAVTTLVMGIIVSVFLSVLSSVQTSLVREEGRSRTMDQARLAMETLDRDIRSGNILCSVPASPANFGLSVYTQSNATSSVPIKWVQYRVNAQTLQRRQYLSSAWTGWRTVASGVTNTSLTPPFTIDTSPTAGSRVVNVTLLVNAAPTDPTSKNTRVASSLSIRNQSGLCGSSIATAPATYPPA